MSFGWRLLVLVFQLKFPDTAAGHVKGDLNLLKSQVLMPCKQTLCMVEGVDVPWSQVADGQEEDSEGKRKWSLIGTIMSLGGVLLGL